MKKNTVFSASFVVKSWMQTWSVEIR